MAPLGGFLIVFEPAAGASPLNGVRTPVPTTSTLANTFGFFLPFCLSVLMRTVASAVEAAVAFLLCLADLLVGVLMCVG